MRRTLTLIPITLVLAAALVACGAGDNENFGDAVILAGQSAGEPGMNERDFTAAKMAVITTAGAEGEASFAEAEKRGVAVMADAGRAEPAAAVMVKASPGSTGTAAALQTAERRVIATGFIRVAVADVPAAAENVRVAAEALSGFVENSTGSGGEVRASAQIPIRAQRAAFPDALDRIRRIGEVHHEELYAEDVTEQFLDQDARLRSALHTEGRLLDLLDRAEYVQDVIAIERDLGRVRTDIEHSQGQLPWLERGEAMATLSGSFFTPEPAYTELPSASFDLGTDDVRRDITAVEAIADALGGVVDSSGISSDDLGASGVVEIRVPRAAFARAVRAVEAIGSVRGKTIRTGASADDSVAASADEPDARIDVRLEEDRKTDALDVALIVAFVVAAATAVLLAIGPHFLRFGRRAPGASDGAWMRPCRLACSLLGR